MKAPALIKQHPLLLFFVLTFIISWGLVLILAAGKVPIDPEASADLLPLLYVSMLFGPSVAGILMIGVTAGREGLRKLFAGLGKWRVKIGWYAAALLGTPMLAILVLMLLSLYSPEFQPALFHSDDVSGLILGGLGAAVMVGIFEEIGWTGFAIPRLLKRYSILTTGLLLGLLWGAWHFILFWEADSFGGMLPFLILITRLFTWLPPFRVLMVWIYDRTGSMPLVMLTHVSLVFATTVVVPMTLTGTSLLIWLVAWSAALWILLAGVILFEKKQLSQRTVRE